MNLMASHYYVKSKISDDVAETQSLDNANSDAHAVSQPKNIFGVSVLERETPWKFDAILNGRANINQAGKLAYASR